MHDTKLRDVNIEQNRMKSKFIESSNRGKSSKCVRLFLDTLYITLDLNCNYHYCADIFISQNAINCHLDIITN